MQTWDFRLVNQGDRDWIIQQHAHHYAENDGFDSSFKTLVTEIVDAFFADHDPTAERGWMAETDHRRLGCIFCVRLDAETAKLRLFFLHPEARGQGLGRAMLRQCMTFAKAQGYLGMRLWTHESHRAACALYKAEGWHLESEKPVVSFGQTLTEQQWGYRF